MVWTLKLCMCCCWYISAGQMTVDIVEVYFRSLNFYTVLHWRSVCDPQSTCSYDVQYKVYGERGWTSKTDCEVARNACNITAEMLMKEHVEEKMLARVRARTGNVTSLWKMSEQFEPLHDTNISAPTVILTASVNSIQVNITAPKLIYHLKYPKIKEQKKISFNIKMSTLSKLLKTENTEENSLNITDLVPGHYCITVDMMFEEIRSSPSRKQCVKLKGLIAKEVIIGSILAVFASVAVVVILAIYLFLYRHFHPKTRLPSNLILHGVKSKASEYKSDETFIATSIFQGMELSKYILESKESMKERPQSKRYISTEALRKDYVNWRQKDIDRSVLLNKTVELRNSTYGTNATEKYLPVDYPIVWISSQTRYTKEHAFLRHTQICKDANYYNSLTACEEDCKKTGPSYMNQDEELLDFYINV